MSIVFRDCPDCGERLEVGATVCACGWREVVDKSASVDEHHGKCAWISADFVRCPGPGVFSRRRNGQGPWFCAAHK